MPTATRTMTIYDCFDNDEYMFTGTIYEIRERLGLKKSFEVCNYYEHKYRGRYWFKKAGTKIAQVEFNLKNPAHFYKKDEEILEYLRWHLLKDGNTVLTKDPTPYLPALADMGINVKVRKAFNYNGRRRKSWYHVLEVI